MTGVDHRMTGRHVELEIAKLFGSNLVQLRREAGMQQEELARAAGLHRTEVSALERGVRLCRIDTLVKLTSVLGVSPARLLRGVHWTPPKRRSGAFHFLHRD